MVIFSYINMTDLHADVQMSYVMHVLFTSVVTTEDDSPVYDNITIIGQLMTNLSHIDAW